MKYPPSTIRLPAMKILPLRIFILTTALKRPRWRAERRYVSGKPLSLISAAIPASLPQNAR